MVAEREFAAELFEGVFGEPPPATTIKPWTEWAIEVHLNDGTQPIYEFDAATATLHCYFHEGQILTWESLRRFIFMIAGKQSGKTVFGPLATLRAIQAGGAGDYLAVSATFDLFKLKMLPELKALFVETLGIARYWAGDRLLEFRDPETFEYGATYSHEHEKMWARLILRTAESEEGMQSASAKWAWLDEPGLYSADVWKDVRGRLSLNRGGCLGTTTPYNLGWLKQQIYDPWAKDEDPEIDVIQFESRLSPWFSDEEWDSLQRSMQRWEFEMDYRAVFGRPPAVIYEDYIDELRDAGGHLVKRFVIPEEWPRVVFIDPGVVNPGKLWAAYDAHENIYYLYRAEKGLTKIEGKAEPQRLSSKEHAERDVSMARKLSERVIWWAIGAKSEKYWREDYRKAGAQGVKEPDVSDVEEGIDRGTQLIREHRFLIFDDLDEFRDEILRYAREIKDGVVLKTIKDKNTFHLIDAFRYGAVQIVKPMSTAKAGRGADRYA